MSETIFPAPVFEGSEKRIEVDFALNPRDVGQKGLRALPRAQLDGMLTLAACEVVNTRSNTHFDSYVLSESSLFVYPRKCVLKTCGTTKLLAAVPRLLQLADTLGMLPVRVKYSRASYLFPDAQPDDHKFFSDEAAFLDSHFGHLGIHGGRAHVLGDPLKGLQWHVYTAGADLPPETTTRTLEVCMTGLDPVKAAQFYRDEKFVTVEETTRLSGITSLAPLADMDAVMFEPCGYSLNALHGTGFMTIHITPEEACSYASVEFCGFNCGSLTPSEIVERVASIFDPKNLAVCMSTDARVCDETWKGELALPAEYATASDTNTSTLQHGGFLVFSTAVKQPLKQLTPEGSDNDGHSPRGPLPNSLSFASSAGASLSFFSSSRDSRSSPGSPTDLSDAELSPGKGLVRTLTDLSGGSLEVAAVLASYGAVPMKSPSMGCLREKAMAVISASDPDTLDFFYIYDLGMVARLYSAWMQALPRVHPHYAVKCNCDPGLVATLAALGAGFDCASRAEMDLVMGLGVSGDRVIFANCCKHPREMRYAMKRGVEVTVVDSCSEIEKTAAATPDASVLLRIRADDPNARCQLGNKYGAEMGMVPDLLQHAKQLNVNLVGVAFHVGSGAEDPVFFEAAIEVAREVFDLGLAAGFDMKILDIGGGLMGIVSDEGDVSFAGDVPVAINSALDRWFPADSGITIIAEPGRFFAEAVSIMATQVFGQRERLVAAADKRAYVRDYYITDGIYGSFNSIMYDHHHPFCEPLRSPLLPAAEEPEDSASDWQTSTVFGPTCDGLDIVAKCPLPPLRNGDWLLWPRMGAYTISAACNFNGIAVTDCPPFYVYSS
mmetsp:Transcript_1515/g.4387  ORF Transcript_1515/g.4387 Transcript_1515/m.4387 type:complete len:834 (-) Transcript_1515:245-2746(-)|eukprot:CAMPEP_0117662192 /NCGR_PEP_ID=MMETSP0804-20121206/7926_1 /TAXON_ID=1074897 /ORGANISM="Tetraselmis astigmatica, Strain CCMP880" /LENGTH=833 /DNA_ID=CAMNT_0005469083 /DNA_START=721 /DNA_END=3222 /DNA_ORIENTATION=+